MLLRIFRRNAPVIPVLILVIGLLLWLDAFIFFDTPPADLRDAGPLFFVFNDFFLKYPLLNCLLAFLILLIEVFLLNQIVHSNDFLGRPSWLPGFIYLLMMSSHSFLLQFHPVLVANLFLLFALARTLDAFSKERPMQEIFNAGFLVAVAGLFYFPALMFFIWLILSMTVLYLISKRGLAAAFMGLLCPFFFLLTFYFLTDQLELGWSSLTEHFNFVSIPKQPLSLYTGLLVLFLGILALFSFLKLSIFYINDKPIRIRKRFKVAWYFFLVALFSFLMVNQNIEQQLALVMIPLSVVTALFLLEIKRKWLAGLWLYGFIILIIVGKVLCHI